MLNGTSEAECFHKTYLKVAITLFNTWEVKMSLKLNNKYYVQLLKENIEWLKNQKHSLEKNHLILMCQHEIKKSGYCIDCYNNLEMFTPDIDRCSFCKKQYFPYVQA